MTTVFEISGGQDVSETQVQPAPGLELLPARSATMPRKKSRGANQLGRGQDDADTQTSGAPSNTLDESHACGDTQNPAALVSISSPASQFSREIQIRPAGGGSHRDPYLALLSDMVDDLEGQKTATGNRLAQMTRKGPDADGVVRGFGMDERSPQVAQVAKLLDDLKTLEKDAVKALEAQVRKHHVYPWIKKTKGIGAKSIGRLLAKVNDPYWHEGENRPRTVSELWAYCGLAVFGGHAQRLKRGVQANWSTEAKMRAYLAAKAAVMSGVKTIDKSVDDSDGYDPSNRLATNKYAQLFIDRRAATLDRVHSSDCVRCGPSGLPALVGSPWSGAHQMADALRVVSKEILKDLWVASRDYRP